MSDPSELTRLLRAVRGRVPLDAAQLLSRLPPERVAEVLAELPYATAERIQAHLPAELRQQTADELADAVAGTVHEMMEIAPVLVQAQTTVQQAVELLRAHAVPEEITYLYVVDPDERLVGLVVIRDLLLAGPTDTLNEILLPDPFALAVDMELGDAIKAALKRHYPVYPVVDSEQHLVGQVRGWRLFERQAVEISAQSGQMVGVDKQERLYTGIWASFRMRHPWLQVNLLTAFLAGFVVSVFEGTIAQIVALAAFLPILAGQSGNNGCQALAITLRGITLGDMDKFSVARLLRKEVALGSMNGLLTGTVAALAMWWTARDSGQADAVMLGLVILLAMTGACMISGMFGVLVPLALRRFGADPAVASSIFLTTGTDIAGMGLMLLLATVLVL
ncbi:MAG: magnesium transporter [Panacagrimonas sp.]